MTNDMQDVINEISENKIKLVKVTKKQRKEEENQLKPLIFAEKKKRPSITVTELSKMFGVSKDVIEIYLKEQADEIIKQKEKNATPRKPGRLKKVISKLKNIKDKGKEKLDNEDKKTIKSIFARIVLFGVPLNFSLWVIFGFTFNFYSWIAWGWLFWFIKKEIVNILRSLWKN